MPSLDRPAVVWLRDDLRMSDNPALSSAVASGRQVVVLYVFDDSGSPAPRGGGGGRRGGAPRAAGGCTTASSRSTPRCASAATRWCFGRGTRPRPSRRCSGKQVQG